VADEAGVLREQRAAAFVVLVADDVSDVFMRVLLSRYAFFRSLRQEKKIEKKSGNAALST
jgi:hypothetical protein